MEVGTKFKVAKRVIGDSNEIFTLSDKDEKEYTISWDGHSTTYRIKEVLNYFNSGVWVVVV